MSNTPDKFCFIVRGLPGSGKDLVVSLFQDLISLAPGGSDLIGIINSDEFFKSEDGKYRFDKTKLQEAHKASFIKFKGFIEQGKKIIIVNNTNIKQYHYYHYLDYAQRNGYLGVVTILPSNDSSNLELAKRNIHGIDTNTIRRMRQNFEWGIV